jgi:hypothetical protein
MSFNLGLGDLTFSWYNETLMRDAIPSLKNMIAMLFQPEEV